MTNRRYFGDRPPSPASPPPLRPSEAPPDDVAPGRSQLPAMPTDSVGVITSSLTPSADHLYSAEVAQVVCRVVAGRPPKPPRAALSSAGRHRRYRTRSECAAPGFLDTSLAVGCQTPIRERFAR